LPSIWRRKGAAIYFLQRFCHRYFGFAKVNEIERYMAGNGVRVVKTIDRVLGVKLEPPVSQSGRDIR
jgi:hypothetical protein